MYSIPIGLFNLTTKSKNTLQPISGLGNPTVVNGSGARTTGPQFYDTWYIANPLITSFSGPIDLTAVFKPATKYTVTVQSEDTNKGSVSGGGTCYEGGSVPVYASPKSGWIFEGWYLNGSKISGSKDFSLQHRRNGAIFLYG